MSWRPIVLSLFRAAHGRCCLPPFSFSTQHVSDCLRNLFLSGLDSPRTLLSINSQHVIFGLTTIFASSFFHFPPASTNMSSSLFYFTASCNFFRVWFLSSPNWFLWENDKNVFLCLSGLLMHIYADWCVAQEVVECNSKKIASGNWCQFPRRVSEQVLDGAAKCQSHELGNYARSRLVTSPAWEL